MLQNALARLPLPTPESLAHRARIAALISPLKRTRPKVPFWKLSAHRVPTLWTLYRGLLKEAPGPNIRFRVRMLFKQNRRLTSPAATKEEHLKGHKWLDAFVRARDGDPRLRKILRRYEKMIAAKREKEWWKHRIQTQLDWQAKLRHRPIMTGAYFRPSPSNRALPRLKPQPIHITGMITRRRAARERRVARVKRLTEWKYNVIRESEFESRLVNEVRNRGDTTPETFFKGQLGHWLRPIDDMLKQAEWSLRVEEDRASSPYPSSLLAAIKQARRDKNINKTRELARERQGEILPRTLRRRRQGPTAHVLLTKMSPERRQLDKVARRSVSEVGYVGKVKRKLGWKLRDPEAWKVEEGSEEDQGRLDAMEEKVRHENLKRRSRARKENK